MENGYSLSDLTAATGGNGGFGGGSAWVLIILFALIFGWGGNGFGGNAANAATTADIQRAVDLNGIQQGQASIAADVQRAIYEINGATKDAAYNNLGEIRDVGTAVTSSGANIINALTALQSNMQNCCCETKQTVMENRYLDSQNANAIQAALSAQNAALTSAVHAEGEATRNMLQQDKIATLQNQVNTLEMQNAIASATAGVVKYPMSSSWAMSGNPFCSGGCGCSAI